MTSFKYNNILQSLQDFLLQRERDGKREGERERQERERIVCDDFIVFVVVVVSSPAALCCLSIPIPIVKFFGFCFGIPGVSERETTHAV